MSLLTMIASFFQQRKIDRFVKAHETREQIHARVEGSLLLDDLKATGIDTRTQTGKAIFAAALAKKLGTDTSYKAGFHFPDDDSEREDW
jgi:hypothetical protein